MFTPFGSFLLYKSLKLHFKSRKYDYFLYNGKTRNSSLLDEQKFNNNKLKFYYKRLSNHKDPTNLIISNLIINPQIFITDLVAEVANDCWSQWVNRQGKIHYNFSQEIKSFDSIKEMRSINNGIPLLLQKYISKEISPETLVMLDSFLKETPKWDALDHPLVEKNRLKFQKYRPFITFDKEKVKNIMINHLNN